MTFLRNVSWQHPGSHWAKCQAAAHVEDRAGQGYGSGPGWNGDALGPGPRGRLPGVGPLEQESGLQRQQGMVRATARVRAALQRNTAESSHSIDAATTLCRLRSTSDELQGVCDPPELSTNQQNVCVCECE